MKRELEGRGYPQPFIWDEQNGGFMPQFVKPQPGHFADAIRLGGSVEGIWRVMDPAFYMDGRALARSLAYRLANTELTLEEISQYSNLQPELFKEHLRLAHEAFQWAAGIFSTGDNLM